MSTQLGNSMPRVECQESDPFADIRDSVPGTSSGEISMSIIYERFSIARFRGQVGYLRGLPWRLNGAPSRRHADANDHVSAFINNLQKFAISPARFGDVSQFAPDRFQSLLVCHLLDASFAVYPD
jgi:hypothetical protein